MLLGPKFATPFPFMIDPRLCSTIPFTFKKVSGKIWSSTLVLILMCQYASSHQYMTCWFVMVWATSISDNDIHGRNIFMPLKWFRASFKLQVLSHLHLYHHLVTIVNLKQKNFSAIICFSIINIEVFQYCQLVAPLCLLKRPLTLK